jgi:F0F1-type ATP synthase assembly protein I
MADQRNWFQPALQTFARLSGWIAFPVIIGAFLGKWLDKKYDTEPWLFLTTIGIAFLISMIGLVTNTVKEFKQIEKTSKIKKEQAKQVEKSVKQD